MDVVITKTPDMPSISTRCVDDLAETAGLRTHGRIPAPWLGTYRPRTCPPTTVPERASDCVPGGGWAHPCLRPQICRSVMFAKCATHVCW